VQVTASGEARSWEFPLNHHAVPMGGTLTAFRLELQHGLFLDLQSASPPCKFDLPVFILRKELPISPSLAVE